MCSPSVFGHVIELTAGAAAEDIFIGRIAIAAV
jgi:hypothetical protein